ncbi:MAG: hypothetical protein NE334_01095 [Lentisphaeraceae bacterium]|nr:hypothetical protein [Lentisphaeraceae bacterium]
MKHILFALTALFIFTACEREKLPKEVQETLITIHSIDNTGVQNKLVIPIVVDGRQILVSRIPLLSNHDIMSCGIFQYREDQYGLEFQLTDKGRISWQQAAIENRGTTGVLAEGGKFKCFMKFSREVGGYKVKIAAPLSKEEAETISENIQRNYIAIKENS